MYMRDFLQTDGLIGSQDALPRGDDAERRVLEVLFLRGGQRRELVRHAGQMASHAALENTQNTSMV